MAIDLASKITAVEWENMLPLEMLAAVATETLKKEINPPKSSNKIDIKNVNKRYGHEEQAIEDVSTLPSKLLSTKSLINKFSVLTSDEMNKKYSFRCKLLPDECNVTYQSFGNEKKALDRMKLHLISHLNQLKRGFRFPLMCEKSSKVGKKSSKKKLKYSKTNISKNHISFSESHKKHRKYNFEIAEEVLSKAISSSKEIRATSAETRKSDYFSIDDISGEYDCHMFSKHTNPIFIKDELFIDEDIASSASVDCEKLNSDNISESPFMIHDHDYIASDALIANESQLELTSPSSETVDELTPKVLPQFIIKTPAFPHIHIPVLPEVAQIIEFDTSCHKVKRRQLEEFNLASLTSYIALQCPESPRKVVNSKKISRLKKKEPVSSVLECLENKVSVKISHDCPSKTSYSSNENAVENVENMQKVEKELALKLIAKLHLKRKKQYQGPLECQICQDKHFTALATLIHHYRSHAGIKPYTCNLCASTFTRQHSLNYHMLIHQNLSRFKCAFCGRTFRHPSHYKEHLRRHTGETPFRCYDCNLHFKTRNTYKRHLKIRHKKLLTAHGIEDLNDEQLRDV